MRKDAMLLFLSDVKLTRDAKEVKETVYHNIGEPSLVHTTNESAVRYLVQASDAVPDGLSRLFLLQTKLVKSEILTGRDSSSPAWIDDYGETHTHYDYFLHRIEDIVPDVQDIAVPIDFDEEVSIEESLTTLVRSGEEVRRYADEVRREDPDADIVMHVDCTGGLRHANMLLIALTRLLRYDGIRIGKVLYSDLGRHVVVEGASLYDFFDMVAGAEEFVRFGSVNTLRDYFTEGRRAQSGELRALLGTMNRFSAELELCRYGKMQEAVRGLRDALTAFLGRDTASVPVSDQLMMQLAERIRQEYAPILGTDQPDLALIRWCIGRDLLQQAMTLVTERVPEILYGDGHGFLRLAPEWKADFDKQKGSSIESDKRGPGYYLLNWYKAPPAREKNDADEAQSQYDRELSVAKKAWGRFLLDYFNAYRKNRLTEEQKAELVARTPQTLAECPTCYTDQGEQLQTLLDLLERLRSGEAKEGILATEPLASLLPALHAAYARQHGLSKKKKEWEALGREAMQPMPSAALAKEMMKLLAGGVSPDEFSKYLTEIRQTRFPRRRQQAGLVVPDSQLAEEIDNLYCEIRDERNNSNHAKDVASTMSIASLRTRLARLVEKVGQARKMGGA